MLIEHPLLLGAVMLLLGIWTHRINDENADISTKVFPSFQVNTSSSSGNDAVRSLERDSHAETLKTTIEDLSQSISIAEAREIDKTHSFSDYLYRPVTRIQSILRMFRY